MSYFIHTSFLLATKSILCMGWVPLEFVWENNAVNGLSAKGPTQDKSSVHDVLIVGFAMGTFLNYPYPWIRGTRLAAEETQFKR